VSSPVFIAAPCKRVAVARANRGGWLAAETGGATLVGIALAGFVLMVGVVAVDVAALAGVRAAAQTAADMAALAALAPAVEPPPGREREHQRQPEPGSPTSRPDRRTTPTATAQSEGADAFRASAWAEGADAARAHASRASAWVQGREAARVAAQTEGPVASLGTGLGSGWSASRAAARSEGWWSASREATPGRGLDTSGTGDQARDGHASRAADIAMANGAELVACDCSAVQAVVRVRRLVRLVPGGLTVSVTARARAVLGRPPS
jgi:hypothetical protein